MVGTLVALAVSALFLKVAVHFVGSATRENTFLTGFLVALAVAVVGHVIDSAGGGTIFQVAYVVSWLFIVKSAYGMGWLGAAAVGIVLFLVLAAVKFTLIALGVASLGALALII